MINLLLLIKKKHESLKNTEKDQDIQNVINNLAVEMNPNIQVYARFEETIKLFEYQGFHVVRTNIRNNNINYKGIIGLPSDFSID